MQPTARTSEYPALQGHLLPMPIRKERERSASSSERSLSFSSFQLSHFLLDIDPHQAGKVAAENLLFGLGGQLWVAVAGHEVFGQFKVPEGVERPARVPDGRLTAIEYLVLATPEHQLAHIFGENTRRAHDEIQGCRYRGIQVGIAHQLPANLIDERQAHVENDEVEVREVSGGSVHIPGLCMLDRLRAKRHAFMHTNGGHTEFEGFLALQWIDTAPKDGTIRIFLSHSRAFLPLR